MFRLILATTIIFVFTFINAQNKSISILSLDGEFMLPTIEEQIMKLRYKPSERIINDSILQWIPYFTRIINLNSNRQNNFIYSQIKSIYELNNLLGANLSDTMTKSTLDYKNFISRAIIENEYLLLIKNNTHGNFMECQFLLYKVPKDNEISLIIDQYLIAKENFILDLSTNPKLSIQNRLKALFINSNNKPIAKLLIDGTEVKDGSILDVPTNTNIIMEGGYSYDYDNDDLTFHWKNKYTNRYPEKVKSLTFQDGSRTQNLKQNDFKTASIMFYVNDGANNSDSINVILNYIPEPKSIIFDTNLYYYIYDNSYNRNDPDSVSFTIRYLDDSKFYADSKIIVSKRKINEAKITKEVLDSYQKFILPHTSIINSFDELDSLTFFDKYHKSHKQTYIYSYSDKNKYKNEVSVLNIVSKYRSPLNFYVNQNFQFILSEFDQDGWTSTITNYGFGTYLSNKIEIVTDFVFYNREIKILDEKFESFPFLSMGMRYNIIENYGNHNSFDSFISLGVTKLKNNSLKKMDIRTMYLEVGGGFRLFERHNYPINFVTSIAISSDFVKFLSLNLDIGIRYNIGGN